MQTPDTETRARIERLFGHRAARFEGVEGGYTPAARWRVVAENGERCFAKMGTNPMTATALRAERDVYGVLEGSFLPRFLAFEDDADHPLMLIEDLGDARWPPPWDDELVADTRRALDALHGGSCPALPPLAERHRDSLAVGWSTLEADPDPFLRLGLCSERWLDAALPALCAASDAAPIEGESPTHFDVRSDNLCRTERGVVLVDWNLAARGDARLDLGFWLPSLGFEGGPAPDVVLPDAPEIASWVCGFFAARAGGPPIPDAPRVRWIQQRQLEVALPWAVRALDLPPLDGVA